MELSEKNRKAVERLAQSSDARKLRELLNQQSGQVRQAAQAAAAGDPRELMSIMDQLMHSKEVFPVAGFEEQLNSILGNQEAMGQIMALARSLSGEQPAAQEPAPAPEGGEDTYAPVEGPPAASPPDLSALLGQVDPQLLQAGMEVFRQLQSAEDRNTALVNALRPFLREDRQTRLDRAVQLARTAKLVRAAMGVLRGKEGERV